MTESYEVFVPAARKSRPTLQRAFFQQDGAPFTLPAVLKCS